MIGQDDMSNISLSRIYLSIYIYIDRYRDIHLDIFGRTTTSVDVQTTDFYINIDMDVGVRGYVKIDTSTEYWVVKNHPCHRMAGYYEVY
jgi:hypothetical protein